MPKLLYIPHPHSKQEYDDFYLSFANVCKTLWYPTYRAIGLPSDIDFIYLQSGGISRTGLLSLKEVYQNAKVCQWTGDCRKERIENVMWCYDLCDINYLAAWQPELYPGMRWMPHGVADWQFREINQDAKGIVFIGNAQLEFPGGKERYELCLKLEKRKDFTWYGTPKPQVDYRDTPDIYNKHKFAIGASIFYDVPLYFSNRTLAAMAAGCACIQRGFPWIDDILPILFSYSNYNQFIDAINFNTDWESYIISAQNYVHANYHYDVLAKQVIDELTQLS